jgi:hypothetical protein
MRFGDGKRDASEEAIVARMERNEIRGSGSNDQ